MINDVSSQTTTRIVYSGAISTNDEIVLLPIDTSDLLSIGFYIAAAFYADGNYSLSFDDSEDGLEWAPLPADKLIGSASVSGEGSFNSPLTKVGIFSSKKYLRPKIVPSGVTDGVLFFIVSSVEVQDIFPAVNRPASPPPLPPP